MDNNSINDTLKWDNIIATNGQEDTIQDIINSNPVPAAKSKARGRPRKQGDAAGLPPGPPSQSESFARLEPLTIGAEAPEPEKQFSNAELVEVLRKSTRSQPPSPRRKNLRVSLDTPGLPSEPEDGTTNDPDRLTLLRMYKQYFRKPLLDKHQRKEKIWSEKHPNSEIYREIKELDALCSEDDPAQILSQLWVQGMTGVEVLGPIAGLQTQQLSVVAGQTADTDQFRGIMRELLIKYPYLRQLVGLGGLPELKLIVITATAIRMVHDANSQYGASAPIPEDLKSEFSTL